ncbi:DNA internalization-related competence protein ComEC/Rec2 [Streptococcus dentasini]
MSNFFPFKPIYLAFLLILIYYLVVFWHPLVVLLLAFVLSQLWRHYSVNIFGFVLAVLLVFGLLIYAYQSKIQHDYRNTSERVEQLTIVPDTLSVNGDQLSFHAKAYGRTYQAFYRLRSRREKEFYQHLTKQVVLHVSTKVEKAQSQCNFHGFDYQSYLKNQQIYRVVNIEHIESVALSRRLTVYERLHELRRQALVYCQGSFPSPMDHYMTGLLFGYLDRDFDRMSDIYTSLGIIHLFALSGMQVGFFVGTFRRILLRIGIRQDWVDILQVPFSVFYAAMTGFAVSVVRSLIQSWLKCLGLQRLDNMAITIFIMFALMPQFLLSLGGILSFTYAFILAVFDFEALSGIKKYSVQGFSLSLGILPVLLYSFSAFQPLSVPLTAIFSLLFDTLLLPFLSLTFLISPLIKLTSVNIFFVGLEKVISGIYTVLGRPPIFGSPSLLLLLAMILALAFLHDYWSKKTIRYALMVGLFFLLAWVKHPLVNEVTMIDVGQGDSIFIRDSWGKTILIDTGGRVDFGEQENWQKRELESNAEKTVIPYLKSRGVGKIDQLVLTHTDTDHIGDLEEVAENFKIGEILVSPGSLTKPSFVSRLRHLEVNVRIVQAGDQLPIMGSQLKVLYPNRIGDGGNNDSLILYGRLLNKTFLFTGDLETQGEAELLQAYPTLHADILKVGHHGSKGSTSQAFLEQLRADTALISVGQHNRYKHPSKATLRRLDRQGIAIYRTDKQGAIRCYGLWCWSLETVR